MMRVILFTLLMVIVTRAQFGGLFSSQPSTDDFYDQFGMKNALGVWSDAIRKIALRNNPKYYSPPSGVTAFTIEPPSVNPNEIDINKLKKGKGDGIINEKLLTLLLPRIKGQNPFTTTTKLTTTTTTTTPATVPTTTTTSPSTTTQKSISTTTEEIIKRTVAGRLVHPDNVDEDTESVEAEKKAAIVNKIEKSSESVEFTTDDKNFTQENDELNVKNTTILVAETSTIKAVEKTTAPVTESTTPENKKTTKDTKLSVKFRTVDEDDEQKDEKPSYIKKLEEIYKKEEELVEKELAELSIAELFDKTKKNHLKNETEKTSTAKPTTTIRKSTKTANITTTSVKKTTTTTPTTTTTTATTTTTTTTFAPTTTTTKKELTKEEALEIEALEVLKSLDLEEKDDEKHNETVQKRKNEREEARKKINNFLKSMKRARENREKKLTTSEENSKTTQSPVKETTTIATTTTEATTHSDSETITTSSNKNVSTIPEAEEEEDEIPTTSSAVDTTIETTTIKENEGKAENSSEEVKTKKLISDDSSKNQTAIDDDDVPKPQINSIPPISREQLAQMMTPVAGIIDDIRPILSTLLTGSGTNRAKAAAVRTYQNQATTGVRDIMADGYAENSLVGFGSQIAREILRPGVLRRDKENRERAMAARIEEAKTRNAAMTEAHQNPSSVDLAALQQYKTLNSEQAQTSKPNGNLPYFVPPPPGYVGPLPPAPPPPPPSFLTQPQLNTVSSETSIKAQPSQRNAEIAPAGVTQATPKPNDQGYEQGRDGVKNSFFGDSGVMFGGKRTIPTPDFETMPLESFGLAPAEPSFAQKAQPPPKAATAQFGSGRKSGFGGGSGPSVPFEEVQKDSKTDFSFFTSGRKKV